MDETTAVDSLISALNTSGVNFVRDAWYDVNNDLDNRDYGIVELIGSPNSLWGDDQLVEQHVQGNVVLYVADGADDKAAAVQDILKEQDIFFQLQSTEYLMAENKNRWTWRFRMDRYFG